MESTRCSFDDHPFRWRPRARRGICGRGERPVGFTPENRSPGCALWTFLSVLARVLSVLARILSVLARILSVLARVLSVLARVLPVLARILSVFLFFCP